MTSITALTIHTARPRMAYSIDPALQRMDGHELRAARRQLGASQRELAAALGVTRRYVILLEGERAEQPLRVETALAVRYLLLRQAGADR